MPARVQSFRHPIPIFLSIDSGHESAAPASNRIPYAQFLGLAGMIMIFLMVPKTIQDAHTQSFMYPQG